VSLAGPTGKFASALILFVLLPGAALKAAELQARTIVAFDRYVRVTEARINGEMEDPSSFLFLDSLPEKARRTPLAELQKGRLIIERLRTKSRQGHRPFQLGVLGFELAQPLHVVHRGAAVLAPPLEERGPADAVLPEQRVHRQPALGVLQNPDDLRLTEFRLPHDRS
jgi:hypothetical protein